VLTAAFAGRAGQTRLHLRAGPWADKPPTFR